MSVLQWIQLSLFSSHSEPREPIPHLVRELPTHVPFKSSVGKDATPDSPSTMSEVWQTAFLGTTKPIQLQFGARGTFTWSLQWRQDRGLTLRLPPTLRNPPLDIAQSLIEWALVVSKRGRNPETKTQKKSLETRIRDYLDQSLQTDSGWKKREAKKAKRRLETLRPQGQYHDLQSCFDGINQEYFHGSLKAQVTWSRKLGGLSTHCEKVGPDGDKYHLITLSLGYDAPDVTPEILGGVMYHECLHIVYPPKMVNSRRVVHGAAFKKAELQYRHYETWMHWHRHGLTRSLKNLRRAQRAMRKTNQV